MSLPVDTNDEYVQGYDAGFAEARKDAWFTIVMTGLYAGLAGLLAGMAIVDFVL